MTPAADLLETVGTGIFAWKGPPQYGRQDLGYSPGGAQDRFSYRCGNILLENDPAQPALEMLLPPRVVRFAVDCCFVLTGGRLEAGLHPGGEPVEHAVVYLARAGSRLDFGRRYYGRRTYLCCRPAATDTRRLVGRRRGAFAGVFRWPDRNGRIRLLQGPEVGLLKQPGEFFQVAWKTTNDMSDMGIRLSPAEAGHAVPATLHEAQMVSAPVCDGTIQMTPSGPIVLLRDRQTVGGYPRLFAVISADVDLLAQFGPEQRMRFAAVPLEEARAIAATQTLDLQRLAQRLR